MLLSWLFALDLIIGIIIFIYCLLTMFTRQRSIKERIKHIHACQIHVDNTDNIDNIDNIDSIMHFYLKLQRASITLLIFASLISIYLSFAEKIKMSAFDLNFNGKSNEPYEKEIGFLLMGFDLIACVLGVLCLMVGIYNRYAIENTLRQRKIYDEDYALVTEFLSILLDEFEQLSTNQKRTIASKQLAEIDATGLVHLKFICPISMQLILQPLSISVINHNNEKVKEIYEYESIKSSSIRRFSPLTRLPIVRCAWSKALNAQHLSYILQLRDSINALAMEPEDSCTYKLC